MNVLFGRGAETTFSQDLTDYDALALELQPLLDKVRRHFETMGARGRTATLKVKFSDFELITRLQVGSRH
jgi:DNA polymerase IV